MILSTRVAASMEITTITNTTRMHINKGINRFVFLESKWLLHIDSINMCIHFTTNNCCRYISAQCPEATFLIGSIHGEIAL